MRRFFWLGLVALAVPACIVMRPWGTGEGGPPDRDEPPSPALADNRLPDEVREVLYRAEQVEVRSLEPAGLHGGRVLGRTAVTDRGRRRELLRAVEQGIAENDGTSALCFIPRHAIRATHEGRAAELVLCFKCYQVRVYLDGVRLKDVLITDSPRPVLDRVLTDADVPLAPGPGRGG